MEHVGRGLMRDLFGHVRAVVTALSVAAVLSACGGGGDGATAQANDPPPTNNPPTSTNRAPTISGQPGTTVAVGEAYSFKPTGTDADGDTLTYSVTNKPAWLNFNSGTGELSGTPAAGDVGNFAGIAISVSDGKTSASLTAFAVTVNQISTGSAQLNWSAPLQNTDGSSLTNLSGYKVLYGRSADALDQSISISNPSLSTYLVPNLSTGTWFFAMVALNAQGVESARTNVISLQI
jgi:hypothetical protein